VHWHAPVGLQVWPIAHDPHESPPVPHSVADWLDGSTQVVPLQQPFGHDVGSHAHFPFTHSCPIAQETHAPPAEPQAVVVGDFTHMPFVEQQPEHAPPPQVQA
jgi:hypothetical protein